MDDDTPPFDLPPSPAGAAEKAALVRSMSITAPTTPPPPTPASKGGTGIASNPIKAEDPILSGPVAPTLPAPGSPEQEVLDLIASAEPGANARDISQRGVTVSQISKELRTLQHAFAAILSDMVDDIRPGAPPPIPELSAVDAENPEKILDQLAATIQHFMCLKDNWAHRTSEMEKAFQQRIEAEVQDIAEKEKRDGNPIVKCLPEIIQIREQAKCARQIFERRQTMFAAEGQSTTSQEEVPSNDGEQKPAPNDFKIFRKMSKSKNDVAETSHKQLLDFTRTSKTYADGSIIAHEGMSDLAYIAKKCALMTEERLEDIQIVINLMESVTKYHHTTRVLTQMIRDHGFDGSKQS
jgi:hypothetical protein